MVVQARIAFQMPTGACMGLALTQPLLLYGISLLRVGLRGPVAGKLCLCQGSPSLPGRIPVGRPIIAALYPGGLWHAICHGLQLGGRESGCCITWGAGRGSSRRVLWAMQIVQRICHEGRPVGGARQGYAFDFVKKSITIPFSYSR